MERMMNVKYVNGRFIARDPQEKEFFGRRRSTVSFSPDSKAKAVFSALWKEYADIKKDDGTFPENKEVCQSVVDRICSDPSFEDCLSYVIDFDWVDEQEKRIVSAGKQRMNYLRQKCAFANFNYFVTFTFSDEKTDEETFKLRLKQSLERMTQRNGWTYLGVWQRGDNGDRLHFHALIRVPEGGLSASDMYCRLQWSSKRHKREQITSSRYFDKFGNNDFRAITPGSSDYEHAINYVSRYITRGHDKVIYSRRLKNEIQMKVDTERDVAYCKYNFGKCYVLHSCVMWNQKRMDEAEAMMDMLDLDPDLEPVDWFLVTPRIIHKQSEILDCVLTA